MTYWLVSQETIDSVKDAASEIQLAAFEGDGDRASSNMDRLLHELACGQNEMNLENIPQIYWPDLARPNHISYQGK